MYKVLSLCFLAIFLIAGEATPSTQVAAKVSDILSKREEVVKKADAAAIKELKSLLLKFKKDKQTSILIAVKLHKLSAEDPEAIAILKDVPVGDQDLLGDVGEPGKYLGDVQAKLIADALAKGKFTGKDWDALPGKIIEVSASYYKSTHEGEKIGGPAIHKGSSYIVIPQVEDKWQKGKETAVSYLGKGNILKLQSFVVSKEREEQPIGKSFKSEVDGVLEIMADSIGFSTGSIRVKVYEVVPTE